MFYPQLRCLVVPINEDRNIAVYKDKWGYGVIYYNDLRRFDEEDTLELIAYIHELRGYL